MKNKFKLFVRLNQTHNVKAAGLFIALAMAIIPTFGLVLAGCTGGSTSAESNFNVSNLDDGQSVIINKYVGEEKIVNIPSIINGKVVTKIRGEAFLNNTEITRVTIPDSVTDIDNTAFLGCTNLARIIVDRKNPNYSSSGGILYNKAKTELIAYPAAKKSVAISRGVTSIGDWAFSGCTDLAAITIPAGVTSIGKNTFIACTSLAGITVDRNNPEYASEGGMLFNKAKTTLIAFPSAGGSVIIPNNVTSIGDSAFSNCKGLNNINIPASVISIGDNAFASCTGLASIDIPAFVTSIGDGAFYDCTGLFSVNIPGNVTSIGDYTFYNCIGLNNITIPANVKFIGDYAFSDCTNLTGISIPAGVTSIGERAFSGTRITDITIPASVSFIGSYAFASCDYLTRVIFAADSAISGAGFGSYAFPTETGYVSDALRDAYLARNGGAGVYAKIRQSTGFMDLSNASAAETLTWTKQSSASAQMINENDYILPYSNVRELTYIDLRGLTKAELRLARNEIFARHGRVFVDQSLQEYFNSKTWYMNLPKLPLGTEPVVSGLEQANIELIQDYEAR